MIQPGRDHADEFADAHVAAPQTLLAEDDGRKTGPQGPVQVEECADLGSGRAGHDFGDRTRQPKITRRFLGLAILPRHFAPLLLIAPLCIVAGAHEPTTDRFDAPDVSASNVAGTACGAGSPASARISLKPSSRHRANSASSRIAARS